MLVRLLGPVDVLVGEEPVEVAGLRRAAVLAALALHPGQVVSVRQLIDIVWGEVPPSAATATLRSHVSYLRRLLGSAGGIVSRPAGYLIDLGGHGTDVQAAQRLIGQAKDDAAQRERLLREAIALWRGDPLAGLTGSSWFDSHAHRFNDLLAHVRESLVDTQLVLGQHADLVPELEASSRQHPYHEPTYRQLMIALYRCGRQEEALNAYQRLRRALHDDLGIVPSQQLRDLETAILRQDPTLNLPATARIMTTGAEPGVPAQLPVTVTRLAGRTEQLTQLDATLDRVGAGESGSMVIVVMSGSAGVGKTTLALHWAHRVASRFRDGQLYVNLRGFDPGGSALDPAEAVRGFLDALGVAPARIPPSLHAQAAMLRSLLTGRRMLIVLDNARDAAQVRPLLPAGPGCVVVVTSRSRLTPLIVAEDARPLTIGLLTRDEALDLLAGRLGPARIAAEPAAADEIVAGCSGLPLALSVVAARAAVRPNFPLVAVAGELRDAAALDALDGGDDASDVRAVLSWSYRGLSNEAAALLRLLSLYPGPDIGLPAVVSLTGQPPAEVRRHLGELLDAHLLDEPEPGRYTFHDLLRAYAMEQSATHDDAQLRRVALHRLLDHYLHTAFSATKTVYHREPIDLTPPQPGVTPERHAGYDEAVRWFAVNLAPLLAAVQQAAAQHFDALAWQLAWVTNLFRTSRWHDLEIMHSTALRAAQRVGDALGQAQAAHCLARGRIRAGRLDESEPYFHQALHLYQALGDHLGQGHAYTGLGDLAELRGNPADMLENNHRALDAYRASGHRDRLAAGFNGVGWAHSHLGNPHEAIEYCRQALAIFEDLGERVGQAAAHDSLGHAYQGLADHRRATEHYLLAVGLFREFGERYREGTALTHLGDIYQDTGDIPSAATAWRQALHIFDEMEHPAAEQLRARLHPNDREQVSTEGGSPKSAAGTP